MKTRSHAAALLARTLILCLTVILLGGSAARGQESTQAAPTGEISCSSDFGNVVELDKTPFHLAAASANEISMLRKAKSVISEGPFSGGTFSYDSVDIYLIESKPNENSEAALSIYGRATKNKQESWFKVTQDREPTSLFDFFTLTPGDTSEESTDASGDQSATGASLAAKGRGIPIFEVRWWRREVGASTEAEVRKILLLDFRTSSPSIMSAMQCVAAEGGGACGVYDNGSAPTTGVTCNWDAARGDFLCESTVTGDYAVPLTTRYYLSSGAHAPFAPKPDDPPNLSALGMWVTTDRSWTSRTPEIPGLGAVTFLAQYSSPELRGTAVLFASRGRDSAEPRFFAVIVDPQGPARAFEIRPQPLIDVPVSIMSDNLPSAPELSPYVSLASIDPAEKFADEQQPSFQVKVMETSSNVTAWQVAAKQGNVHEVIWLAAGRNPNGSRFVFSAVRIASEAQDYARCGNTRSKPFAAGITRKLGSLNAALDAEPAHEYDQGGKLADSGDQGEAAILCPMRIRVAWNNSLGFIRDVADAASNCPTTTHARELTISDAGIISTTAPDAGPAK